MPAIEIRPARLSDATQIADVHIRSWQNTYAGIFPTSYLAELDRSKRVRMWQSIMLDEDRRDHVMVASQADTVLGFIDHGRAREAEFQDWREIYAFYIEPDMQGRGIGQRLLKKSLQKIETRGDIGAYLWVVAANPARYFYEAQGGMLLAERDDQVAGEKHRLIGYGWPFIPVDTSSLSEKQRT